jgi:hypothetical protein
MHWRVLLGVLALSLGLGACERTSDDRDDGESRNQSSPASAVLAWPSDAELGDPADEMVWGAGSSWLVEDARPAAVLGVPETDFTLLWITCTGAAEMRFDLSIPNARPTSGYDAMIRVGDHVVESMGRSSEALEYDGSVFISFLSADPQVRTAIAQGRSFDVIAKEAGAADGWRGIAADGLQQEARGAVAACS